MEYTALTLIFICPSNNNHSDYKNEIIKLLETKELQIQSISLNYKRQGKNAYYTCDTDSFNLTGKEIRTIGDISSLISGKYIAIIDLSKKYPPNELLPLIEKVQQGKDLVIGNEQEWLTLQRNIIHTVFVNFLHKFDISLRSPIKVMKREIIERIHYDLTSPAGELTFLVNARNGGYIITINRLQKTLYASEKQTEYTFSHLRSLALTALKLKFLRAEIIPFHPEVAKKKGKGFHYKGQEYIHHSDLSHEQTAFYRLSGKQIILTGAFLPILGLGLYVNWHATLVWTMALITCIYFADLLFNLFLIYRSFSKPSEIQVTQKELASHDTSFWPTYTVYCPLYKEWRVLPQFIKAIGRLDYPKEKLQIVLLLEENDQETIMNIKNYKLPKYFEIIIVPHSNPKTKPKACNYGLQFAKGEYTVIYDAEDIPDPLQLKKVILAFQKVKKNIICIQAKLNFYNPHQNLLTRVFTAEYSLWFDLVLTGLQSVQAPIPLGGTSNHFRTADLHMLKGWDSFNVTEDCDLGMRLVKLGYKTAIVDSTTLEEANAGVVNWFWQRTRWIKGYMQTYLLHMRRPQEFLLNWREPHVITFQLVVGGKVMSMLINPLMWVMTILYFTYRSHFGSFIESFFPTPIFYMAILSLLLGNFLYMYYYMIGCAKHGHDELVKYVILVPIYWLAMSLAAYMAVYKLITQPHYWSKTNHGLHLSNKKTMKNAQSILGYDLLNEEMKGGFVKPAQAKVFVK